MTDEKQSEFFRLRRLQEQNLSNIPGLIAQRALSSFTLQQEPLSEEITDVRVLVYPQDPFVGEPEVRTLTAMNIKPGLINSRIRVRDSQGNIAQPDEDGNYYYTPGEPEFDQVNAFYYANYTLRMFERYANRQLPWSFPSTRLDLDPHVGQGANAFYSEQDRMLGFYGMEYNGEKFVAAQSADVVCHETAHAVLDGVRDLHNESFGLGSMAFHESFGDMAAVLVALHDDSLVTRLLVWTKGNLRTENFIARLAEQMSKASPRMEDHIQDHTIYLRNAINDLRNSSFSDLSYRVNKPETELAREPHNYSRLFTGAFYDILVGIYEKLRGSMHERIAIHRTRHILGRILMCAIELGPVGEFTFEDMAKAFLTAGQYLYQDKYLEVMVRIFDERKILSLRDARHHLEQIKALPDIHVPEILNTSMASARFLEETIAPKLKLPAGTDLTPMAAYRDAVGTAYLSYFSHQRLTLQGDTFKQFAGSHVDIFGGLTLMFDKEGWLRSSCYRPVNEVDTREISALTKDLIDQGLIASPPSASGALETPPLHLDTNRPRALWIPDLADLPPLDALDQVAKPSKLVKFPVIFDGIPKHLTSFREYLTQWLDQRR